jgi:hypothetical protein
MVDAAGVLLTSYDTVVEAEKVTIIHWSITTDADTHFVRLC